MKKLTKMSLRVIDYAAMAVAFIGGILLLVCFFWGNCGRGRTNRIHVVEW